MSKTRNNKKAVRKTTKKATAAKKQATLENLSFADGELKLIRLENLRLCWVRIK